MMNSGGGTIHYRLVASFLGDVGVVWEGGGRAPLVVRVMLPRLDGPTADGIRKDYPDAVEEIDGGPGTLCRVIGAFLEGRRGEFSLDGLAIDRCPAFQKRVLCETVRIPPGRVTSYGELAEAIHAPGAARAVGTALATNPFPLIIPCHRVVKTGGYLGQFGGGTAMKKSLLLLEGVAVDGRGRIPPAFFR